MASRRRRDTFLDWMGRPRPGAGVVSAYTASEMMTISAARAVGNDDVCFVGIGAPSAACNLARLTHAPDITLIYESGAIGTRPDILPLSIGDGELAETAITTVSVPEMFRYWLQGGRIPIGFLGAAQLDRFGNINTTVIGPYDHPKVRLPGGGGAPEIATSCREVFITLEHSTRTLVRRTRFHDLARLRSHRTERTQLGVTTRGTSLLITDLLIMRPEAVTNELVVDSLHPGVTREQVQAATGWEIRFRDPLGATPPPDAEELAVLRDLQLRTDEAHRVVTSNRAYLVDYVRTPIGRYGGALATVRTRGPGGESHPDDHRASAERGGVHR